MAEQLSQWVRRRDEQDDLLYERLGQRLELEHTGEFVTISDDGRIILGPDELSVAEQALEQFGRGTFALRRIGAPAEMSCRAFA